MDTVYLSKEQCSGCTACSYVCPSNAIKMQPDAEGFQYPVIDIALCSDCGICKDICPFSGHHKYKEQMPDFYVAIHKSKEILMQSTSGGAFTALSDIVLNENGIIYGVDFDENFNVVHSRANCENSRNRMRMSKYVQSDMTGIFTQIKIDLEAGKKVMFTGTPCQAAGLKAFMPVELTDNLFIVDIICYGIPSPMIWDSYKKCLEEEHSGKLTDVHFRTKKLDWGRENSNKLFEFKIDGELKYDDRFAILFTSKHLLLRPSCGHCSFTDIKRVSDITIADYWGIEKYAPEWFDKMGVSVVMTNSDKGRKLFCMCDDLKYEKRPSSESLTEQNRLSEPVKHGEQRKAFFDDVRDFGFAIAYKKLSS